jgi:formylglycine-generating enzyme required for sulfatase activity
MGSDAGDSGTWANDRPPAAPGEWVLIDVSQTPFTMGSPATELGRRSDEVEHRVTLTQNYWLMTTPVTQVQFLDVMGYNPSSFMDCGSNCPVEMANWHELASYTNALSRLEVLEECYDCTGTAPDFDCVPAVRYATPFACPGYRLPTEAEWEYAARGGTTTATYAGELTAAGCDDTTLLTVGWFCGNANSTTHPVGEMTANDYGLYDMLGNVWEWCHDLYGSYSGGPETDPAGASSGPARVMRGSSWIVVAGGARAASRGLDAPDTRAMTVGGRALRTQR